MGMFQTIRFLLQTSFPLACMRVGMQRGRAQDFCNFQQGKRPVNPADVVTRHKVGMCSDSEDDTDSEEKDTLFNIAPMFL